jgi:hypothetical protein
MKDNPDTFESLLFPPSDHYWLEWRGGEFTQRLGCGSLRRMALSERGNESNLFVEQNDGKVFHYPRNLLDVFKEINALPRKDQDNHDDSWVLNLLVYSGLLMVIINSPKIIGRREHQPHKGLVRQLKRTKLGESLGTLRPWHEIRLQITKPRDIDDGHEHADTITGRRALHFCRRHLRVCASGKLTYVSPHWRGDPTLGVRNPSYVAV